MDAEAYRELKVLEELAADSFVTQRTLSQKLEVALGLTNLMIRRLVTKGHIKVVNLQSNRIRYLLTPKGIAEKSRLTYEYLNYSLFLYRRVREVLREQCLQLAQAGQTNVVICGVGEVAEIAYLTLKECGLNLVAVVDDKAAGSVFLGMSVLPVQELTRLAFDRGIVASLTNGMAQLRESFKAFGVPEDKLIVIEHNGITVRAVLPGGDRAQVIG